MKIAIVHDELIRRGGAEQVVRCFHMAFPEAPIFTMAYDPGNTYPYFQQCRVEKSWFQVLARSEKLLKLFFYPLGLKAMQHLDVSDYEVVLMSSTYAAKYVKVSEKALVINYCHQPFRLAWFPESYGEFLSSRGLKRMMFNFIIKRLKTIDFKAAQRADFFIANTAETGRKIQRCYQVNKQVDVIKPPVNCANFYVSETIQDYYLVVGRLEYYKKVDLVVEAFNDLGLPLIIVGKGSKEAELKKMAKSNISFQSGLSAEALKKLYAQCKAFVFPQLEDYGITPLEANASGRPVIAFGQGGVLETMIPYSGDPKKATALFFEKQEKGQLIKVIQQFESLSGFDPLFIRKHAELFDESHFITSIQSFVLDKYQKKKK